MDGTITKSTKVEYKKRRNPRAFRIWNSNVLSAAMLHAVELKHIIEKVALEGDISLDDMKPTTISTEILYLLVDSYLDVYKSALHEGLIKTGNPITNLNIH